MHNTDHDRTTLDRLVPWLLGIITVAVLAAVLAPAAVHAVHSLQVLGDTLAPAAAQAVANLMGGQ